MGVPTVIDFWVQSLSIILVGMAKGIVNNDEIEEGGVNYQNKEGDKISDTSYRGITRLSGREINDWVININSLGDVKGLLDNDNFKKFPLYQPVITLELVFVPDELYDLMTKGRKNVFIEASHMLDVEQKSIKKIGSNDVLTKQHFNFTVTLPVTQLDSLDIDQLRKEIKPTISHELTHAYEVYNRLKVNQDPIQGREAILNLATNLMDDKKYPLWSKFLYLMYLHLSFEINARITEFYYELKEENVETKEQFLDLLKNSKVFEEIKMLEDFKAEEFIKAFKLNDFIDQHADMSVQYSRNERDLPIIKSIQDPKKGMLHLISGWNTVLQTLNHELDSQGIYKGKLMDLVPKKAMEDPIYFFKFFEERFHKKAERFKRRLYKVSSLILNKS